MCDSLCVCVRVIVCVFGKRTLADSTCWGIKVSTRVHKLKPFIKKRCLCRNILAEVGLIALALIYTPECLGNAFFSTRRNQMNVNIVT